MHIGCVCVYVYTHTHFFFFSELVKSVQCFKHDPHWAIKDVMEIFLILLLDERVVETLWVMDLVLK